LDPLFDPLFRPDQYLTRHNVLGWISEDLKKLWFYQIKFVYEEFKSKFSDTYDIIDTSFMSILYRISNLSEQIFVLVGLTDGFKIFVTKIKHDQEFGILLHSTTGWPKKHHPVFLVPRKIDLSSICYCTLVHWTCLFLQGTMTHGPVFSATLYTKNMLYYILMLFNLPPLCPHLLTFVGFFYWPPSEQKKYLWL